MKIYNDHKTHPIDPAEIFYCKKVKNGKFIELSMFVGGIPDGWQRITKNEHRRIEATIKEK